jgi:hypothetical protein
MKFFIPLSSDPEQSERIFHRIQKRVLKLGYGTFHERTYQVIFRRDGKLAVATVGDLCPISLETVLAIFKHDHGYMIVSYSRGAVGGEPVIINNNQIEAATFFEG